MTKKWGHVQLTTFLACLTYQFDNGGMDDVTMYGANLFGQFNLLKADKIIDQALYGPGVTRYRGGVSSGLDANGNLEAIVDNGFTLGYQHHRSDKFTSLAVHNHELSTNTDGQLGSSLNKTDYIAANLVWHFYRKHLLGQNNFMEPEFNSETDGSVDRLQFSVKYVFN